MKLLISLLLALSATSVLQASEPLRIAVVDTGLNLKDPRFSSHLCSTGHKDFSGFGLNDNYGHGTHVTGLIQLYARNVNYCMIIVKYTDGALDAKHMRDALDYVAKLNVTLVNISAAGPDGDRKEMLAMQRAPNTLFIGSAGNNSSNKVNYPCGYKLKNTVCVGSTNGDFSNYGSWVKVKENGDHVLSTLPNGKYGVMSGTSMSTAIFTGKLVNKYGK